MQFESYSVGRLLGRIIGLTLYPLWRVYYYCKFFFLFNVVWPLREARPYSRLFASREHQEKMP